MHAIEVSHLTKVYRVYAHPRDRLKEYLLRRRRRLHQEVWALRDVAFRVPKGSTFGIVGNNGSGKSTLLQLLAGTLTPTSGAVSIHGRVSSILELGTGFHHDFTGRENAFMSGAVMGISRKEMEERLDGVIAFAEIGDFIDLPVKMYSTGMYVRLAFAVATSVDPDILILDEALSVGDQYFQKRSIDRIDEFRKAGRTIIFCSHNTYQVRMICDQVIWLSGGRVALMGDTLKVVGEYESYLRDQIAARTAPSTESIPSERGKGSRPAPWIGEVCLVINGSTTLDGEVQTGDRLGVAVSYRIPEPPTQVHVGVRIFREDGIECYGIATHLDEVTPPLVSTTATITFPSLELLAGNYYVEAILLDETGLHPYDSITKACRFRMRQPFIALGLCRLSHSWSTEAFSGAEPDDGQTGYASPNPVNARERL
jgi:ABC-type polysaccharide/polyol phosphate transport system ATPase subunit